MQVVHANRKGSIFQTVGCDPLRSCETHLVHVDQGL